MYNVDLIIVADQPIHHCALPIGTLANESLPTEMQWGVEMYTQCNMYRNHSISNETMACPNGWYYDPASGYDSTIVTQVAYLIDRMIICSTSIYLYSIDVTYITHITMYI